MGLPINVQQVPDHFISSPIYLPIYNITRIQDEKILIKEIKNRFNRHLEVGNSSSGIIRPKIIYMFLQQSATTDKEFAHAQLVLSLNHRIFNM